MVERDLAKVDTRVRVPSSAPSIDLVAQAVEHLTFNQRVAGSIPAQITIIISGGVAKWLNAADCKSALYEFGSSNLSPSTIKYADLAQLVEQLICNQ